MAGKRARRASVQSRPCPDDFEIVFIEQGRLECESWYRARRTTITRWLEERGKDRLIAKRAAFVKHQRKTEAKSDEGDCDEPVKDHRKADPQLVEHAIAHLRMSRNGGWAVTACECGDFIVGTRRRSPAEVIDMAEKKGFDRRRALAQIEAFAEPV